MDRFTGKERDSESGLDNFGARYDSSSLGRFMSPDWSDDPDPVPYADLNNPQTLNLYAYVGNNPVTFTDDDGHDPFPNNGYDNYPNPAGKCGFWCWFSSLFRGGSPSTEELKLVGWWQPPDPLLKHRPEPNNPTAQKPTAPPSPAPPTMAAVGVVGLAGSELGPADLALIAGAAATVLYAQNAKHINEVMDGLAAQIRRHLDLIANNPQSPDPQGGWKREIRAALERMRRQPRRIKWQQK